MIDVTMRYQDRIDLANVCPQSLLPKVDRSIYKDRLPRVLDEDRNP
jgi:hypothetical protein